MNVVLFLVCILVNTRPIAKLLTEPIKMYEENVFNKDWFSQSFCLLLFMGRNELPIYVNNTEHN